MKIHFIGIGGIGISALAQYYLAGGHEVSGSDLILSEITEALRNKGAKILIGRHKRQNLSGGVKKVIYTPAVSKNNPELQEAGKLGIACQSYPEALGDLTEQYFTIAVSGTHGKSTTTAMLALILIKGGLDPTVILGTKLQEFGSGNFRRGQSKYLIIEADEHFASFLNYWPKIIVVTNIDKDHLDYYKNLKNIRRAFREYIGHLPKDGLLIINSDDRNSKFKIKNSKLKFKIQKHSLKQKEAKKVKRILQVPGMHNVSNALAALTVARMLKIPDSVSFKALEAYKGSWRRFEIITQKPYIVVADYAHHPAEIKATLSAAKAKWPKKKIWAVFQPHQYQRTFYLFKDFVKAFGAADKVVISDIFDVAGRENRAVSKKINSKKLTDAIRKKGKSAFFVSDFRRIPAFLNKAANRGDVIMIMGAGDIYNIARRSYWK